MPIAEIQIPQRILLGPGPSDVPPRVLAALARPTIGHLDPVFLRLMDEIREGLREVFRTTNELTLAVSGTGSAGMETCLVNLLEPGDTALVCVNGVFGQRMADVAQRCGAKVDTIAAPWGRAFDQADVVERIAATRPNLVGIVHAETSTGVHQPVDRLAEPVHQC